MSRRTRVSGTIRALTLLVSGLAATGATAGSERGLWRFSYAPIDTFEVPCDDESCAEIAAFDPDGSRLYVTNALDNNLRLLDVDPDGSLVDGGVVDLSPYGAGGPNSVAVSGGRVAVALAADPATDPGTVVILDADGAELQTLTVGALPDMVTFTPDGRYLLVANEGEPSDDYAIDPPGSISVVDTRDWSVRTAGFESFGAEALPDSVRIFGPGAGVAEDLEPEYIAVSADSRTAWVTLQENNALAIVDVAAASVTDVVGLGFKVHGRGVNALDASDRDGGLPGCRVALADAEQCIRIRRWPVLGMYQPDAIAAFEVRGREYLVTANEGDARDYDGYSEEARVGDEEYVLDPGVFPRGDRLTEDGALGRLTVTIADGDTDGDGDLDRIHAFGGRSFSVLDARGVQVFDSGAEIERRLARLERRGLEVWTDGRSDNKGPEPEGVVIGELGGVPIAFVGLERTSGVIVYALSNPRRPRYLGFLDTESFGDVGPEGLLFVPRSRSAGVLIVTNEISNTVSSYAVTLRRPGRHRR